MRPDPHAGADGRYIIRSIYFDDYRDKALREKLDGVPMREKFRIRWYNDDDSFIVLEKKLKRADLCQKRSARLSAGECSRLLSGDISWMAAHMSPLVLELYAKMRVELLRPRVLVSYVREPYVFDAGNVRVTFDSNIRTSLYGRLSLDPGVSDISSTDAPGQIILELKYDDYLPEVIARLVQTGTARQQAFSKYGACRRFG